MSNISTSSLPATSPKSTTRFKTHTRTTTEHTPNKVTTRTTTRTTTVTITETPSRKTRSITPQPSVASEEDSDDPDNDAVIVFASDTEVESPPSSPTHSRASSVSTAAPPQRSSQSSHSTPVPSVPPETRGEDDLVAHYETRYPGKVPAPGGIKEPSARANTYYVVTVGLKVGIFTDWLVASGFVLGVRKARHKSYRDYEEAWDMYNQEYTAKRIRVVK
ncbi:hypothetical protein PM082_021031 [Marasmius tenuissimus]|nr:hypothetical protein PM082_021031 [Marasmius tenuissimus]